MAKILVVDDRPFMLRYIEHVVTRAGHKTIKARNGVEVAEVLAKDNPAVVVMDVCPDQMESVQRAITDRFSARGIPVIVMSGFTNQPVSCNSSALKPAAVFHAPFSPSALVGTIAQLLTEAA
jgi:DNA-binding NtrC family response regulator